MSKEPSCYKRLLIVVVLISVSIIVGETFYLLGLLRQLDALREDIEPITLRVNLLIKYDNGTKKWFNNTLVPVGWSLFNLTFYVLEGKVEYRVYPLGVFVTGINGVSQRGNHYWFWYRWDTTTRDWVLGEVGAGSYILRRNDVLAWYLADASRWPPAKP